MALRSLLFSGNARLNSCLVHDSAHVVVGDQGDHVILIQDALRAIDALDVADGDVEARLYGSTTAAAVLAYKKKRKIVNQSYQSKEDSIVGKMTIKALDDDLVLIQGKGTVSASISLTSGRCLCSILQAPLSGLGFTLPPEGITKKPSSSG
jgi:peptidoglycan hydrolase-like protein with peptidoglycan-binding domain